MVVTEYVVDNWALLLVLLGFATSLISTVFLEKKTVKRMYALIAEVMILSIVVFIEFYLVDKPEYRMLRTILIAVRYSATPFLVAQIIFTIVKRQKWYIFIPAIILAIVDFVSIPTGIVFWIDETETMVRGPLGLFPYIVVGIYCGLLLGLMIHHSSKQKIERVPIIYFCFAFFAGIVMPFIIGKEYAQLFCTTIGISVFVYYVFMILQVTKKDPLTGLLNRQAFYADIADNPQEISALISIDMNGLKKINDIEGHAAGDLAITTIADCFIRAVKRKHFVYRVGGDEFVVVCRKVSEDAVIELTKRVHEQVGATKYSCSVGYSYSADGKKPIDQLLSESDAKMYNEKQQFYKENKKEAR
ncbi:MAG: GGDEF domain-containing protein [Clostridiales bacterium]|nr:GGDEF domain-containing protein [Clostridiales bacterium]